jgi:hypothetical protein
LFHCGTAGLFCELERRVQQDALRTLYHFELAHNPFRKLIPIFGRDYALADDALKMADEGPICEATADFRNVD